MDSYIHRFNKSFCYTQNTQKWMNLPGMMLSKISQTAFVEGNSSQHESMVGEGRHWLPLGVVFTGEGHRRPSLVLKRSISLSVDHMGTDTLVESIQLCTVYTNVHTFYLVSNPSHKGSNPGRQEEFFREQGRRPGNRKRVKPRVAKRRPGVFFPN